MDFSKSFDSVPCDVLLFKLQMYGFNGCILKWFTSYLSDRFQRVVLDGYYSEWLSVRSGVPQGSILEPLLFLLCINDLSDVIKNTNISLLQMTLDYIQKFLMLLRATKFRII